VRLNERFLVNRRPIPDKDLDKHIGVFRRIAEDWPGPPTFFEVATATAFSYFAEAGPDVALIEVGMGGRFDATNVVWPLLAAITTIDLEHMRYLGDTLEKIAFEKCGVIKAGVPVVTGETKTGPLALIQEIAAERGSPLSRLGPDFQAELQGDAFSQRVSYHGPTLHIEDAPFALPGRFQGSNVAVALRLAELMRERHGVTEEAILAGLATCRWPCRLDRVLDQPPVYIDVAHNPAGSAALARDIPPSLVVLAVANDKEAKRMLEALEPKMEGLILSQFSGGRSMPVEELARAAGSRPHRVAATLEDALALGMAEASASRPLLITGSIFTAGEARHLLTERYGAPPLRF
jgi:dihydrofolate synthase/folylpolyglutamate synthase